MDAEKKSKIEQALDINDDGKVDYKDFMIFVGVMGVGYFFVSRILKYVKRG